MVGSHEMRWRGRYDYSGFIGNCRFRIGWRDKLGYKVRMNEKGMLKGDDVDGEWRVYGVEDLGTNELDNQTS